MRWMIGSWLFLTYCKMPVILSLWSYSLLNTIGGWEVLYRSCYGCCLLLFSAEAMV